MNLTSSKNQAIRKYKYSQTARMASSKTVFKPFCVSAEHSRYLTAPTSLDMATPCEYWIGAMRLSQDAQRAFKGLRRQEMLTGPAISRLWLDPRANRVWSQLTLLRSMARDVLSQGTTRISFQFPAHRIERRIDGPWS